MQTREDKVRVVLADFPKHALVADLTSDLVYLRLQDARAEIDTGYDPVALEGWTKLMRTWERGGEPEEFSLVTSRGEKLPSRDMFVYLINGAKERAPAATQTLIRRLSEYRNHSV